MSTHPVRTTRWRRALTATAAALIALAGLTAPASARTGDMTEFALSSGSQPRGIVSGPGDALWFVEFGTDALGRISTSGQLVRFALPAGTKPYDLTVGPDGNIWYTGYGSNRIGKVTPTGVVTEYVIPTVNSQPTGIATGADGNIWFLESAATANKVGRVTTSGVFVEFSLPVASSEPRSITAGPSGDSSLYFTLFNTDRIGRITTAGDISIPQTLPAGSRPNDIAVIGSSIWFTMFGTSTLGSISGGNLTTVPLAAGSFPTGIAAGPGQSVWYLASSTNAVGTLLADGRTTRQFPLLTSAATPERLALGPDGNLWVTEFAAGRIARVEAQAVPTSSAAPTLSPTVAAVGTTLSVTNGTWSGTPTSYGYQWQRCTLDADTACAVIPGFVGPTYVLTAADNGFWVRAGVTATNAEGPGSPAYTARLRIGAAAPVPQPTPTPSPPPAPGPTGATGTIGSGVTATLTSPGRLSGSRARAISVGFSTIGVLGTVNLTVTSSLGGPARTISQAVPVRQGKASIRWQVPPSLAAGRATLQAVFTPVPGSPYQPVTLTRPVTIVR